MKYLYGHRFVPDTELRTIPFYGQVLEGDEAVRIDTVLPVKGAIYMALKISQQLIRLCTQITAGGNGTVSPVVKCAKPLDATKGAVLPHGSYDVTDVPFFDGNVWIHDGLLFGWYNLQLFSIISQSIRKRQLNRLTR